MGNSGQIAENGENAPNDINGISIGAGGLANTAGDGFPGGQGAGGGGGTATSSGNAKGGDGGDGMIRITMYGNTGNSQYCKTTFSEDVEPITQVTFAGINKTSSAIINDTLENEFFCTEIGTVVKGSGDNKITLKGNTNGAEKNFFVAYIDWDQDGVFEKNSTERQKIGELAKSTGTDSVSLEDYINVPDNAKLGTTTMRIIKTDGESATDGPCETYINGQAEDYTLVVKEFEDDEVLDDCGDVLIDCDITFKNVAAITQVKLAGIDHETDVNSNTEIERFCDIEGTVSRGGTYEITLKGDTNGKNKNFIVAYIDWSQDNVYDKDDEEYKLGELEKSNGEDGVSLIRNIVVPNDAVLGFTKIRIIKTYNGSARQPCDDFNEGQAEEYTLIVKEFDHDPNCDPFTTTCYPDFDRVYPITKVEFAGINNSSSATIDGSPAVERFCDVTGMVKAGQTYEIKLKGNINGEEKNFFVAYVDFDGDGEYNSLQNVGNNGGEEYKLDELHDSDGTATAQITIPLNAKPGFSSIRIVKTSHIDGSSTWACVNEGSIPNESIKYIGGQIEEYPIFIERECITWEPGTGNNRWNHEQNWSSKKVSDQYDCVIIPSLNNDRYPILENSPGVDARANSVYIEAGASLTLGSGSTLTVEDDLSINGELSVEGQGILTINNILTVGGNLHASDQSIITVDDLLTLRGNITLNDDASFIQIKESDRNVSTGTFIVNRTAKNLKAYDYVYWSSPVINFDVSNIGATSHRYQWKPTEDNGNKYKSPFGNWSKASGDMVPGKGYIVRVGASSWSGATNTFDQVFQTYKPNNGTIEVDITHGGYNEGNYNNGPSSTIVTNDDDNWNLIGNPYPSAINATAFLTENFSMLEGGVRIWTHGTEIGKGGNEDPFYDDFVYNYSSSDYLTYNASGPSDPAGFTGYIASGQGFFVLMKNDADRNTSKVSFKNAMRSYNSASYTNAEFYRSSGENESKKHRIWFDFADSEQSKVSMMVGYIEGATNKKDDLYDSGIMDYNVTNFYSLIDDEAMLIQGRALPYTEDDTVPLGFIAAKKDQYSIGMSKVDGLFENSQDLFLEDLYTNTLHDLRKAPYNFTTEAGTFNDRFVLRYQANKLDVNDAVANSDFKIIATKNFIKVSASKSPIDQITIHDVLGRVLLKKYHINASEIRLDEFKPTQGPLIVKATLANGLEKTQKVIF
ncbi:GEVED domain-containing protein [Formosa haliotis]|uniref:GEVED domain-containing protein n=1 Tax=Formosa haliotis TaxID=1555194 RepID=UPI0008260621|nr:GEVED domain-containing protein [Formosa haliotis]